MHAAVARIYISHPQEKILYETLLGIMFHGPGGSTFHKEKVKWHISGCGHIMSYPFSLALHLSHDNIISRRLSMLWPGGNKWRGRVCHQCAYKHMHVCMCVCVCVCVRVCVC